MHRMQLQRAPTSHPRKPKNCNNMALHEPANASRKWRLGQHQQCLLRKNGVGTLTEIIQAIFGMLVLCESLFVWSNRTKQSPTGLKNAGLPGHETVLRDGAGEIRHASTKPSRRYTLGGVQLLTMQSPLMTTCQLNSEIFHNYLLSFYRHAKAVESFCHRDTSMAGIFQ